MQDAVSQGAKLISGGKCHQGCQFEPTILTDVTPDMALTCVEMFAPIAAIIAFDSEKQAIDMANNTEYGLAGYFFSKNISRIYRVAEALETGMIGINTGSISTEVAPFGGIKQSGIGREGSKYGIDEYVEVKYLCLDVEE
ncbi:MAG: hypothetical protein CR977_00780 [Gammaproteobacteria bacterium]|nr:MAG: hypothetical protein CR977_00780 [Gammaproteobacteria bacterium]